MVIFADDTTIINAGKCTDAAIKNDIVAVSEWFESSKLTINTGECEAMFFGCGKHNNLRILSEELEYKNCCKYLGVHIDTNLRFSEHIDHVVEKLNKFCGLVYRVRHLYPRKCLLRFYNSFAKSFITYGLLLYGTAYKTNMFQIERNCAKENSSGNFFQIIDSLASEFADNKILTVLNFSW